MARSKARQIFLNTKVIILIIAIAIALLAISPNPWREGIAAKSVASGSPADIAGANAGEQIIAINKNNINKL